MSVYVCKRVCMVYGVYVWWYRVCAYVCVSVYYGV